MAVKHLGCCDCGPPEEPTCWGTIILEVCCLDPNAIPQPQNHIQALRATDTTSNVRTITLQLEGQNVVLTEGDGAQDILDKILLAFPWLEGNLTITGSGALGDGTDFFLEFVGDLGNASVEGFRIHARTFAPNLSSLVTVQQGRACGRAITQPRLTLIDLDTDEQIYVPGLIIAGNRARLVVPSRSRANGGKQYKIIVEKDWFTTCETTITAYCGEQVVTHCSIEWIGPFLYAVYPRLPCWCPGTTAEILLEASSGETLLSTKTATITGGVFPHSDAIEVWRSPGQETVDITATILSVTPDVYEIPPPSTTKYQLSPCGSFPSIIGGLGGPNDNRDIFIPLREGWVCCDALIGGPRPTTMYATDSYGTVELKKLEATGGLGGLPASCCTWYGRQWVNSSSARAWGPCDAYRNGWVPASGFWLNYELTVAGFANIYGQSDWGWRLRRSLETTTALSHCAGQPPSYAGTRRPCSGSGCFGSTMESFSCESYRVGPTSATAAGGWSIIGSPGAPTPQSLVMPQNQNPGGPVDPVDPDPVDPTPPPTGGEWCADDAFEMVIPIFRAGNPNAQPNPDDPHVDPYLFDTVTITP